MAALFPRVLLGWETFFYRDFGVLAYPTIYHAHASFWRGEIPLWNPASNCGAPFLAQWGTMVLYPFSIFHWLFPLPWSLNFFCLAHVFLGGLGMHRLAARWIENPLAASVAGTAFVFNGVTLSSLMWPNYAVALGWMPWVVLFAERALASGQRRAIGLAAIIAALQILSGVPEIVLLTWLLLLGVGSGQLAVGETPRWATLGRMFLLVLLISGLVAAQLLPFLDLLHHSQRDASAASAKWALPPWGWGNFLLPLFRCAQTPQGMFIQLGEDFFTSTYLGVIPLALALLTLWKERGLRVWVLAALSIVCLLLALGEQGFLYQALRRAVPTLGFVRYPVKFIVLSAFALPLLAGYGIGTVTSPDAQVSGVAFRQLCLAAVLLIAAIAGALWLTAEHPTRFDQWTVVWQSGLWRVIFLAGALGLLKVIHPKPAAGPTGWAGYALLAVLVADSVTGVPKKNPVLPANVLAPGIWQLENKAPAPSLGEGRVMISPNAEQHLLTSQVPDLQTDLIGKRLALWSHLNLLEEIPKVNGSSTLQLREQKQIESLLYGSTNADFPNLTRFLNVTYATAPGKVVEWIKREDGLPFITAGQQPLFADSEETLQALTSPSFEPEKVVYLPLEARPFVHIVKASSARVVSARFTTHRIDCAVESPVPTMVVVAQSFYHPWHAYVDGAPSRLWRGNHAFQALQVPAGRRQIKLVYEDLAFRIGLAVSIFTLLAVFGSMVLPSKT